MDTQPKIPTLKDSQKPQVKVRGLEAGVTLFDRLKQFKKKDLAFILAGLGTLFMAPLAEHFMMSPESGDGTLQQGTRGKGIFDGSGSNPYEVGSNNGMAPGGPAGAGSDIITPLNVRDPSALVMGPGATQQPPTSSVMPSTPPPTAQNTHSDSDLKDALAASARGVGAAARKALLPIPKVALSSGLRGLGVVNGGSGASAGGGGISSAGLVSGKAANSGSMAGVRGGNNIKSVTRGQSAGDGNGSMDALKKAADAAAGAFNRNGAASALEAAAAAGIPTGNGGAGGGGASGSTDKANGGDQSKDGKSVGESLAFLKAKAIQEAQIDLWKKEQEAGDSKLELLKIRNTSAETFASTMAGDLAKKISACAFKGLNSTDCASYGAATQYSCVDNGSPRVVNISDVATNGHCEGSTAKGGESTAGKIYWTDDGKTIYVCPYPNRDHPLTCVPIGTDATKFDKKKTDSGIKDLGNGVVTDMSNPIVTGMADSCKVIQDLQDGLNSAANTTPKPANAGELAAAAKQFDSFLQFAAGVVSVRDAVGSGASSGGNSWATKDCKAVALNVKSPLVGQLGTTSGGGVVGNLVAQHQVLDQMDGQTTQKELDSKVKDAAASAAGDIDTFVADVKTVKSADAGLDQGLKGSLDPLGLNKIKFLLNSVTDKQGDAKTAASKTAVTKIQASAKAITLLVNNLDIAANGGANVAGLGPQLKPLRGSFDSGGSLTEVIARNADLDKATAAAGGDQKTKLKKPEPPTPKDPKDKEDLTPKGPVTPEVLQKDQEAAQKSLKTAGDAVTAYNDSQPDAETAKTQAAIDDAGLKVRQLQADQKAIDDGIRSAATQSAESVLGAGKKP